MIDYDKMIKIQKKVWDEYRIIHPEFPHECYMMSAVKSVGGSLLSGLLPFNKDQIIEEYYKEDVQRSSYFFNALYELDFDLLFNIVNSLKNELIIDEIIESQQRIVKNIDRIKSLLRR